MKNDENALFEESPPGFKENTRETKVFENRFEKGSGARLRKGKGFNAPLLPDRSVGLLKQFVKTLDSQKLTTVQPYKQL